MWAEVMSWNISQLTIATHPGNETLPSVLGQLGISSSSLSETLLICCSKIRIWKKFTQLEGIPKLGRNLSKVKVSSKLEGILQVVWLWLWLCTHLIPIFQYFLFKKTLVFYHTAKNLPILNTSLSTPLPSPKVDLNWNKNEWDLLCNSLFTG